MTFGYFSSQKSNAPPAGVQIRITKRLAPPKATTNQPPPGRRADRHLSVTFPRRRRLQTITQNPPNHPATLRARFARPPPGRRTYLNLVKGLPRRRRLQAFSRTPPRRYPTENPLRCSGRRRGGGVFNSFCPNICFCIFSSSFYCAAPHRRYTPPPAPPRRSE